MVDLRAVARETARVLRGVGYDPHQFVGPRDAAGRRRVVQGWVILPGRRTRRRSGERPDVDGQWYEDLVTTERTLVLDVAGTIWSIDHVHGEVAGIGVVNRTARVEPVSEDELATRDRVLQVQLALDRLRSLSLRSLDDESPEIHTLTRP